MQVQSASKPFALLLTAVLLGTAGAFAQNLETVSRTVAFDLDAATLDAYGRDLLTGLAAEAGAADDYHFSLTGHTDIRGDASYNSRLSAKRVAAVQTALLELGVHTDRIGVASFGESRPLQRTDDETAHASNRRVEIRLTTERVTDVTRLYDLLAEDYRTEQSLAHDSGGRVVGREGVRVTIPARAFVRADGVELPTGATVDIRIEEATKPSSMVAHRLHTNGASGRLQTGGMVRVTGFNEGRELRLRDGAALAVEMPTAKPDAAMRLYLGGRSSDGAMDWTLASETRGSTVPELTVDLAAPDVNPVVQKRLARIKALSSERDSLLNTIRFPAGMADRNVRFPTFSSLPLPYDPLFGRPLRPHVPTAPVRKEVTRGQGLRTRTALQRETDERYAIDSMNHRDKQPDYEERIRRWEASLIAFDAEEPQRRQAHASRHDSVLVLRVQQAKDYLRESHERSVMRKFDYWREDVAKPDLDFTGRRLEAVIRAAELSSQLPASPWAVLAKAYDTDGGDQRIASDTANLSVKYHEKLLLAEYGYTLAAARVVQLHDRINTLYREIQNVHHMAAREALDEVNDEIAGSYNFEIRTATPQWHNCDHPIPPGEFQLLVETSLPAGVYFSNASAGTVDYYQPYTAAAATYQGRAPVQIIGLAVTPEGIRLAQQTAIPTRDQKARQRLVYAPATMTEVREAIAGLGG